MSEAQYGMFNLPIAPMHAIGLRRYRDTLSVSVNRKGVVDVDTVKGCIAGMAARPEGGCYGACYAHKIARFRGIDFTHSVVRRVQGGTHAAGIERMVKRAPYGFFRVGTMGDPSHAWGHTVAVVEWLAPHAVPVIVTKHWQTATDDEFERLVACGAILNTSVSALDTAQELKLRRSQMMRYAGYGGISIARIVSCDFNRNTTEGAILADKQDELFALDPIIDNPLRVSRTHELVLRDTIRVRATRDLNLTRTMSLARGQAYIGHCGPCPDKCGLAFCGPRHPRPKPAQLSLFNKAV